MKILFLSQTVPYPPKSGVLQRIYYLLYELCRENEVHLIALVHRDILTDDKKIEEARIHLMQFCKTVQFFTLEPKRSRFAFIRILLRSIFSFSPFSVFAFRSKPFQEHVKTMLRENAFDLIHFDTIALAQYLPDDYPVPKVVTHHNVESEVLFRRAKTTHNIVQKAYLYMDAKKLLNYEKKHLKMFSCNLSCSEVDKEKLQAIDNSIRVEVIPNGTDTSYFMPNPNKEKNHIITHIGGLVAANLDAVQYFLSEIWPIVKRAKNDICLNLVGRNAPKTILDIAKNDQNIQIAGFVEDVRPYMEEAALIIVPLRYGGGTKLKVLNSLAMGKAVVSTSIGIEGIDVSPGKNIIVEDTPKKFAESVIYLLENANIRKDIGSMGRRLIEEKYDWTMIGKRQRELYKEITILYQGKV
jgi:glycosyltransferase involved in cell wall biosynthesis